MTSSVVRTREQVWWEPYMLTDDTQKELLETLSKRIKQLRLYEGVKDDTFDDDEEPNVFIGD